jgi:hypothetical protein
MGFTRWPKVIEDQRAGQLAEPTRQYPVRKI